MNREEFYSAIGKYFALSESEAESMIQQKFRNDSDKRRFYEMLKVTMPYFEPFVNKADEKLKRKVGKVFLSKLDYSQFSDSIEEMSDRLRRLFYQTSSKGINTYKILYCSVLTDGNLKRDSENRSRYYDTTRDFEFIYDSLANTLQLTNQEAIDMFEKCSTLIAKGYAYKFPHIYNKLRELIVYDNYSSYRVFREKEIVDILKINPSLFVTSTDRIQDAFDYIQKKMAPKLEKDFKAVSEQNPNMTFLEYKTIMTRKWLKNNSTLLTINSSSMYKKENYLNNVVAEFTSKEYEPQFRKFFQEPISLSILNQISYEKIARNAMRNIKSLEARSGKSRQDIINYLASNPYIIGMDSSQVTLLLSDIEVMDKENPEEKYFDKFFEFGKTLFASNIDFRVKAITDKLKNNSVMYDVDVDRMTDKECLHKFIEIFFDGSFENEIKIERMIKAKEERTSLGEKKLRKSIRELGAKIMDLPKILKDEYIPERAKKGQILSLVANIESLHNERFKLGNVDRYYEVAVAEKTNSQDIENALNLLRDTYEQRRFKLGKKYSNLDQLFERTMDYLGSCFDDKEAITDLFRTEVVKRYDDAIKTSFETRPTLQQQLFGESLIVKNVGGLKSSLKKLDEEVNRLDYCESTTTFNFEK